MGSSAAAVERPVLIVHPEVRDGEYEIQQVSPRTRQVLLSEWGCEDLLPSEKKKLADSVLLLFSYASSPREQVLVRIEGDSRQCVSIDSDMPASAQRCLELFREKTEFVIGIPITDLPAIARLEPVRRISAA